MNVIDILVLGIIFLGAWHGYRKGLLSGLLNLGGTVLALIVASAQYADFLAKIEEHYPVRESVEPLVYSVTAVSLQSQADFWEEKTLTRFREMLPAELHSLMPQSAGEVVPKEVINRLAHELAGTITDWILHILAFAVVFLLVFFLVQLLASILLRPLGAFRGIVNHWGGLLFGAAGAVLGLAVMAGLVMPLLDLNLGSTGELIREARFYSYLTDLYLFLAGVLETWKMAPPLR